MLTFLLALACAPLPTKGDRHDWALADVRAIAWAGDNSAVVAGTASGEIVIWNARSGRELVRWKSDKGLVALSLRGDTLVSGSERGRIEVWHWRTGKLVKAFPTAENLRSLCLHPDGKSVATASDVHAARWDTATGKEIQSIAYDNLNQTGRCISHSPDGELLLLSTGSRTLPDGKRFDSWSMMTDLEGKGRNLSLGTSCDVHVVVDRVGLPSVRTEWDPDNRSWVHDTGGGLLHVQDRAITCREIHGSNVVGFAHSSHHKLWVAARANGQIEVASRKNWTVWHPVTNLGPVEHFVLSPDGKRFAVANERRVMLRSLPKEPAR